MSNQKKQGLGETEIQHAAVQVETAKAFSEGEAHWHKARKTQNIFTRLNANRCLVLSRYFKLLNALDPNAVELMWKALINISKPLNDTLTAALSMPEDVEQNASSKDEEDEDEEDE